MAPLLGAQLATDVPAGHSFTSDSLASFLAHPAFGLSAQQLSVWGSGTVHRGQGPRPCQAQPLDNLPTRDEGQNVMSAFGPGIASFC